MRDSSYFGYQKYNMIGVITLTTVLTETLSSTKLTQGATQKRQILSTVPNTDKYSQEFHITLYAEIVMQKKKNIPRKSSKKLCNIYWKKSRIKCHAKLDKLEVTSIPCRANLEQIIITGFRVITQNSKNANSGKFVCFKRHEKHVKEKYIFHPVKPCCTKRQ